MSPQALHATHANDVDDAALALLECLQDALDACDDLRAARVARARTSVRIQVSGPAADARETPVLSCTGPRPSVTMNDEPAETTVWLSPAQAHDYCAGELQLATALVDGEVHATGRPRKFLVVEPILRALLTRPADEGTTT